MKLSNFGKKVSKDAGILQLMDDLGEAMASGAPKAMFGGGNPAHIPEMIEAYRKSLIDLTEDDERLKAMLSNYDTPQGESAFIDTIVNFFNEHYDFGITARNVAVTPGSQTGYFMLFNVLAGRSGSDTKKVLFPLLPEYIGYVDQAFEPDAFVSVKPKIEKLGEHEFKYHIDFDALEINDTTAAICVSRPTNPSGNVVSNEELHKLSELAEKHDIPLIVDNAYGLPFPGVVSDEAELFRHQHMVVSFSLSKVGLPSSRVGIFIGPEDLMKAVTSANAIVALANPSFGQYVAEPLIASGELSRLSKEYIQPYYDGQAEKMRTLLEKHLPSDLPWRLHVHEGSYFFWLWLEGAKVTSKELYKRLKERGVIVVPGEFFFPGQDIDSWSHASQCLRLNFARPDAELETGVPILAEEITRAYKSR